jgi:hypothetical protein
VGWASYSEVSSVSTWYEEPGLQGAICTYIASNRGSWPPWPRLLYLEPISSHWGPGTCVGGRCVCLRVLFVPIVVYMGQWLGSPFLVHVALSNPANNGWCHRNICIALVNGYSTLGSCSFFVCVRW